MAVANRNVEHLARQQVSRAAGVVRMEIMRRSFGKFGRKGIVAVLPLAVAVTFAGTGAASAEAVAVSPQSVAVVQTAAVEEMPVAATTVAPEVVQPIAGVEDIATDPNAQNHDPMANGAAAGAVVGGAFGAVVCAVTVVGIPLVPLCILGPALQGALVGLIVGAIAPQVIPQVLP
ncbi:hypothetical protein IU449_16120 [Nocardia higoensis]|uniref:Secreted protein n=1 Tax=Nocardia higoensis TaxID=228599 RepID=A0ABS0DC53_9NOCA|nr:hypothetical protein [Nocardia higoensis]MBF6356050.1 hypothetical protein [Nocardia higoensis]